MPHDPFKSVGTAASKINNPYSLAALALILFNVAVYWANLDARSKPWLITGSLLAAVLMLIIILRPKPVAAPARTEEEQLIISIKCLIDCSNVPMYLTDDKYIVLHCNRRIAELLDSTTGALIGRPLVALIERFAARVPKSRRKAFEARQKTIVGKLLSDLAPNSEDTEIIDNSDLPWSAYKGPHSVWIHADKIALSPKSRDIGLFVFYRVERLPNSVEAGAKQTGNSE